MTSKSFSTHECEQAIDTLLERYVGVVHRDDVGPLFGRLADLRRECRIYPLANAWSDDAARAALAPDGTDPPPRTVRWTHVVAARPRRTSGGTLEPALHARIHAAMTAPRGRGR